MGIDKDLDKIGLDLSDDGLITDSTQDKKKYNKANVQPAKTYFMSTKDKPNKKANPKASKQRQLELLLANKLGPDVHRVIDKLVQIAMYDPEKKEIVIKDGKETVQKKRSHFYNSNTQMQALTLLLKYYYGDPRKEIQIDQNVDVKIEKKVADLTKLINTNSERLKLVK